MRASGWLIPVVLGAAFGLFVGIVQHFLFSKESYIAESTLIEPLVFDEFWAISPLVLQQADLIRPSLEAIAEDLGNNSLNGPLVTKNLVIAWKRYQDQVVFRFVIDAVFQSTEIHGPNKRYAKIYAGFHEGLGRRELLLSVASSSPEAARAGLKEWLAEVHNGSRSNLRRSMASWFEQKSQSLRSIEHGGMSYSPDGISAGLDELADQFEVAANKALEFDGSFAEVSEVQVYALPVPVLERLLMWTVIGALLAVFVMATYRAKIRK